MESASNPLNLSKVYIFIPTPLSTTISASATESSNPPSSENTSQGPVISPNSDYSDTDEPHTKQQDTALANEYDKSKETRKLVKVIESLGYDSTSLHGSHHSHRKQKLKVEKVKVTLENYLEKIEMVEQEIKLVREESNEVDKTKRKQVVVLNLCDGTELDGYPGLSVVLELEKRKIPFTGANSEFFAITTSKPVLKHYLQSYKPNVPTSPFVECFSETVEKDVDEAVRLLGFPLIIKPSISYASLSITNKSVTHDRESTIHQVKLVLSEFSSSPDLVSRGPSSDPPRIKSINEEIQRASTVFIEQFLPGREFTALVVGDCKDAYCFEVAERVFSEKLAQQEKFLAFDRYWAGYALDPNSTSNSSSAFSTPNPSFPSSPSKSTHQSPYHSKPISPSPSHPHLTSTHSNPTSTSASLNSSETALNHSLNLLTENVKKMDPKFVSAPKISSTTDPNSSRLDPQQVPDSSVKPPPPSQSQSTNKNGDQLYWYDIAPLQWQQTLKEIAVNAYLATGGSGYGRVDMRTTNTSDCKVYVLEVNANCGLSFGKNSSSLGEVCTLYKNLFSINFPC